MHLHCLSHPASHQSRGNASVMRLVNRGLMSLDGDSAADVIFLHSPRREQVLGQTQHLFLAGKLRCKRHRGEGLVRGY